LLSLDHSNALARAGRLLNEHRHVELTLRALNALPLLRLGAVARLAVSERADSGWSSRFDVEIASLEEERGVRDYERTPPDRLLEQLTGMATRRWGGAPHADHTVAVPGGTSDKAEMRTWFRLLDLPSPRSIVVPRAEMRFAALRHTLGERLVVQRPVGHGGDGTYLAVDQDGLDRALLAQPAVGRWLVSSYAGDVTLNYHGFIAQDGTCEVSPPSLQFAGIAEVGAAFGAYCGCDFSAPSRLPAAVRAQCVRAVERIGAYLSGRGYRGIFGVDIVADGNSIAVVEINARSQGSTWLLGEIEYWAHQVPLLVRQLLQQRGYSSGPGQPLHDAVGTQLVVRHTGAAAKLLTVPQSGIYSLVGDRLVWRRSGSGLLECDLGEFAVVNLPARGLLVRPGGALGRLVTPSALTDGTGRRLTTTGSRAVRALKRLFSLAPAPRESL
jgi:hypothetical protein